MYEPRSTGITKEQREFIEAHTTPPARRRITPVVLGFGVPLVCVLIMAALMWSTGEQTGTIAAAATTGQAATSTVPATGTPQPVRVTELVEVAVTRIVNVTQVTRITEVVMVRQVVVVPVTPTPQPSKTPYPSATPNVLATRQSKVQAQLDHDAAMIAGHDRRVSFFWNLITFIGLPLSIVGLIIFFAWRWFVERDAMISGHEAHTDVNALRANAVAEARQAERDARRDEIQNMRVNHGESDRRPQPSAAEALQIQRLIIANPDMSRSALAISVYGNSGSNYLPKVDYVIEEMIRAGELTPPPLD